MLSGCKDDQTSADATIGGSHVGAMSWALLKTLTSNPGLSYIQVRAIHILFVEILQDLACVFIHGHFADKPSGHAGPPAHETVIGRSVHPDTAVVYWIECGPQSAVAYIKNSYKEYENFIHCKLLAISGI
jgi:hypothetical protein